MTSAHVFVFVAFSAFLLGLRGSLRLLRRYRDVRAHLVPRERLLLLSLVAVAWIITAGAAFFAAASARRVLGFEALDWTPTASLLIATVILFIPTGLDYVVGFVARVPWGRDG